MASIKVLVDNYRKLTGKTIADSTDDLNNAIKAIYNAMMSGEDVRLKGIGVMKLAWRESYMGHNPNTGDPVEIPACFVPKMVFTPDFKARVKELEPAD